MVGVTGIEPATSRPPGVRATTAPNPAITIVSYRGVWYNKYVLVGLALEPTKEFS